MDFPECTHKFPTILFFGLDNCFQTLGFINLLVTEWLFFSGNFMHVHNALGTLLPQTSLFSLPVLSKLISTNLFPWFMIFSLVIDIFSLIWAIWIITFWINKFNSIELYKVSESTHSILMQASYRFSSLQQSPKLQVHLTHLWVLPLPPFHEHSSNSWHK